MWGPGYPRSSPPAPGAPLCPRTRPEPGGHLFAPSRERALPLSAQRGRPRQLPGKARQPDAPGPPASDAKGARSGDPQPPGVGPGRAALTARPAPPPAAGRPPPRAPRAQRPSGALTERRSRSVAAMASSAPGPRAGARTGRDADNPAAGRAPPGRLRLNGSNLATSWKLPLAAAAAAGEAAEPPPPAGPALRPARPRAQPEPPRGLPGSPR